MAVRRRSGISTHGWGITGSGAIAGGGKYTKALWQSGKDLFRRGFQSVQAAMNDPKNRRKMVEFSKPYMQQATAGITKLIEEKGMPTPKLAVVDVPKAGEEKTGTGPIRDVLRAIIKKDGKTKGKGIPSSAAGKPKMSAGQIAKLRMAQLQL